MAILNEDRQYKRIVPTINERTKLFNQGYTPVLSSNVSAASVKDNDLYIRFHNASIYKYPDKADLFERLMAASSKGKWVWRFLRRPKVPFVKVGKMPLEQDIDVIDEEIIGGVLDEKINTLTQEELDVFNLITFGVINQSIKSDISLIGAITLGLGAEQMTVKIL